MNENRCERLEDKLEKSNLREFNKNDEPSVYEDYSYKHLVSDFHRSAGVSNFVYVCLCVCALNLFSLCAFSAALSSLSSPRSLLLNSVWHS